MKTYKVVFCGTWGYGTACLEGLLDCRNIEIKHVFTQFDPASPNVYMDEVKHIAERYKIPYSNAHKDFMLDDVYYNKINQLSPFDFFISCACNRIIPNELIELPKIRAINVHPSLLPKYRGIKPVENAIIHGEKETGISIHEMTEKIDSGRILLQKGGIYLEDWKTYAEFFKEISDGIRQIIIDFFQHTEAYLNNAYNQNEQEASHAPQIQIKFADTTTLKEIRELNKK